MRRHLGQRDFIAIRREIIGNSKSEDFKKAAYDTIPGFGANAKIMGVPVSLIQYFALWQWERSGLKHVSGLENLASIPDNASAVFFSQHVSEGDYALGALMVHAGLAHPHILAGDNLTTSKNPIANFLMKGIFDSRRIITVFREGTYSQGKVFFEVLSKLFDAGTNTLVFPGATRDRTNSDIVELGKDEVYQGIIRSSRKSAKEVFVVPLSITWDSIFRPEEKVDQLVTGYTRQGAWDLSKLVIPLLRYAVNAPLYVHIGKPIQIDQFDQPMKKAIPELRREVNFGLLNGVYATAMNLSSLALKRTSGINLGPEEIADKIKEVTIQNGLDPRLLSDSDIAYFGSQLYNPLTVSNLMAQLEGVVNEAVDAGVRFPTHLTGATPNQILTEAYTSHLKKIAIVKKGIVHISHPLLNSYYAGSLEARLKAN